MDQARRMLNEKAIYFPFRGGLKKPELLNSHYCLKKSSARNLRFHGLETSRPSDEDQR
jgi:hypothetical protein